MRNPQVFPVQNYEYDKQGNVLQYQNDGMSLLDYFAVQAMQGMLASGADEYLSIANNAYIMAKVMLAERERVLRNDNEHITA